MTRSEDEQNEDSNEGDSTTEKNEDGMEVPIWQLDASQKVFEQIRANAKIFEAFQRHARMRNSAIVSAINDAYKVDPQILRSFNIAAERNEALSKWVMQLSEAQKNIYGQQFKGLENVISNLKVWQEQVKKFRSSLPRIDSTTLEKIRNAYPPNWSRLVDAQTAEDILYKDGIPIVWVPPAEILDRMLAEPDRESRMAVLVAEKTLIVKDCIRIVNECVHVDLVGQRPLALKTLEAIAEYPEVAQGMAVNLTDSLIRMLPAQILPNKQYEDIKNAVKVDLESVIFVQMRVWFALAAIYVFYTTHYASSGLPLPKELSRHVSVHTVHIDHFHEENALIAVMLMTSIMRTLQDVF